MGKHECVGSALPKGHLVYWPSALSSTLLTIQNVIHFSNRSTHEMRNVSCDIHITPAELWAGRG